MKPISQAVERRLERVQLPTDEEPARSPQSASTYEMPDRPVLRPPGALPEDEFLDRCVSSGQCVNVCPVAAIRLAKSDDPDLGGKPFIDPKIQACVVCDDLACMNACPSGALRVVSKESINMGTAVLREEHCLRTQGEDCQICVDKCPIGSNAINIPEGEGAVEVHNAGCTGCGVCEMYCPTEPKAIVVEPRGAT